MTDSPARCKPPKGSLFEPVQAPRGLRLALVFGNEAPGGKCPFYKKQCFHCDLGAGEGFQFFPEMNISRVQFFREHYAEILPNVNHLIVYNSGSTLNVQELSDQTLEAILAFACELPNVHRVSFDSREPFITEARISFFLERIRPDQTLSITLGLESQSEEVRMGFLAKRMTKEQVNGVFDVLGKFANRTAVELNVLFQPPGLVGKEAVEDAQATIRYGLSLMTKHQVLVDFNFHPYYPSWKGTTEFPNHPRAIVQDTIKALILVLREIKSHGGDSKIFVGWNDEGHDLQPALRQRELLLYDPGLREFNRSQDENDLRI